MYGRTIIFTLLAPSLWSVIDSVAQPLDDRDVSRYLFKSSDNSGFVTELFSDQKKAGENLEVLKVIQGLKEQAMAKVTVIEGANS
tara:strand:- start:76 stop:330 length:255 start_codon:yes stop_codon:yes gene_type:complete